MFAEDGRLFMDKKVDIVVIDTGFEKEHPVFSDLKIDGISITDDGEKNICNDEVGHGTAICGIISQNTDNAEIFVIKIFDSDYITTEEKFLHALDYVLKNISCDILHMSLGIGNYSAEMEKMCSDLRAKGIVLVSAFDNAGCVSFPAAYDSVLGVSSSKKCRKISEYEFVKNSIVNINARTGNNRVAWINGGYMISKGNSFSAAYISSYIYNMLHEGVKKEDIKDELEKRAKYIFDAQNIYYKENIPFEIKKAGIIPYNKEIHSLVNFSELLNFSIANLYDLKYNGNIGKTILSIDSKKSFIIKDFKEIKKSAMDCLIIGHLAELSQSVGFNIKKEILEICLKEKINVFCLDDLEAEEYIPKFHEQNLKFYYPKKDRQNLFNYKFGKLYNIKSPVLGIFGTSSKQGKFTLQLQLRKLFKENDYKVGQIGSEPTSELFGMDEVFPFGYSTTNRLKDYDFIESVNESIYKLDKKDSDIIIAGCQSGIIPHYYFNIGLFNLDAVNFLIGSNPDAVILCVNTFDDIEYIKRSIAIIENMNGSKVIALAVSPLGFLNSWDMSNDKKTKLDKNILNSIKDKLKTEIGLQSFIIGEEEIRDLYNLCIDFFS